MYSQEAIPPPPTLFSDRSEYDLLTSGGENFSLWKVDSAKAKELAPRGSTPPKRKGTSVLVKKRTWVQPVNKVLFAPFGQVCCGSYSARRLIAL